MESMMKLSGKGAGKGGDPNAPPPTPSFTDPETIKHMEKVVSGFTKDPKAMAKMAKNAGYEIPEDGSQEKVMSVLTKCLPRSPVRLKYLPNTYLAYPERSRKPLGRPS